MYSHSCVLLAQQPSCAAGALRHAKGRGTSQLLVSTPSWPYYCRRSHGCGARALTWCASRPPLPVLVQAVRIAAVLAGRPPLPVLVQVNTSGEESKYGVEPGECVALAKHVHDSCKHLRLAGLMTIGMPGAGLRGGVRTGGVPCQVRGCKGVCALPVFHARCGMPLGTRAGLRMQGNVPRRDCCVRGRMVF
jgi:hypothetical protein